MDDTMQDDLRLVARYVDEDGAKDAARSLVERGIGASVAPVPGASSGPTPGTDGDTDGSDGTEGDGDGDSDTAGTDGDTAAVGPEIPGEGTWGIWTVPVDARRAAVLLGYDAPAAIDDPEAELEKAPIPWKQILIIWAIAMVVLPVAAFFASYYLTGR